MELAKCGLCDKPFVFKGNGVYEATCHHRHDKICAICGEGRVHHVGAVKACYGGMGTSFTPVTDSMDDYFARPPAIPSIE